ncbi:MAG: prepilin-type N-terminal cleavage/methylation domain-containing protein [Candidatus Omnitrophota bacterium]
MRTNSNAVTLIELLVALILLGVIVLGLSSLDIFSRFHVISADRRAKIQNEVSLAIEHMTKELADATGNEVAQGTDAVIVTNATQLSFNVDTNQDGIADLWRAYRRDAASSQIWYCPACSDPVNPYLCSSCTPAWGSQNNTVANNIVSFSATESGSSFITVNIGARWNPSTAESSDNPVVNMSANLFMPSVSTN